MIRRFFQDDQGNVAIIAALVILPVLMLTGVGVEYNRISTARGEMQTVVDSVALNEQTSYSNRRAAEQYIANMINANSGRETASVDIEVKQDKLRITANDVIDTPLLSTIGQPKSSIDVVLEIPVPEKESKTRQTASKNNPAQPGASPNDQRRALKQLERKLMRVLKRVKAMPSKYPAQKRKMRLAIERKLREVRRQMRNLG